MSFPCCDREPALERHEHRAGTSLGLMQLHGLQLSLHAACRWLWVCLLVHCVRAPRTIFDYSNCCHRNGCDCVLLPVSVELSWRNKDIFFVGDDVLSPTSNLNLGDTTCDEVGWWFPLSRWGAEGIFPITGCFTHSVSLGMLPWKDDSLSVLCIFSIPQKVL